MNEKINLKEIQRKAYTSYHQDGLIDIFAACFILSFAAWDILDMAWLLGWMSFVIGTSIYAAAKRALTIPRIGFVKFPQQRTKGMLTALVALGALSSILGLITFMQVEGGTTPAWLLLAIEYYMLVIGVSVAALFCAAGYAFRIERMYAYAILTLIIFVPGHFLNFPLYYYLLLLGTLILLLGLAQMTRFIHKYPRSTTDTTGESGSEQ
jgi:hypothetical protein